MEQHDLRPNDPDSENRSRVISSLKAGRGAVRLGYRPTADLRELKSKSTPLAGKLGFPLRKGLLSGLPT